MTREELLSLSDERDVWLRRVLDAERYCYLLGYDHGFRDGGEELYAGRRALPRVVDPCQPTLAELERRRWGPGGRGHFADPRPAGDFPGLEVVSHER